MIKKLLYEFMSLVEDNQVEVYNEFSLQHELGIFLREHLSGYKVQFERNTKFFGITGTIKHEIDIVIYNETEKYAIELKYPVNGQYPDQMYSFIKDIAFMEQLHAKGFTATYSLTMVTDKNFYAGKKNDGIYVFFRENTILCGKVKKPTGNSDEIIEVSRKHTINWEGGKNQFKYYIIDINTNT